MFEVMRAVSLLPLTHFTCGMRFDTVEGKNMVKSGDSSLRLSFPRLVSLSLTNRRSSRAKVWEQISAPNLEHLSIGSQVLDRDSLRSFPKLSSVDLGEQTIEETQ